MRLTVQMEALAPYMQAEATTITRAVREYTVARFRQRAQPLLRAGWRNERQAWVIAVYVTATALG